VVTGAAARIATDVVAVPKFQGCVPVLRLRQSRSSHRASSAIWIFACCSSAAMQPLLVADLVAAVLVLVLVRLLGRPGRRSPTCGAEAVPGAIGQLISLRHVDRTRVPSFAIAPRLGAGAAPVLAGDLWLPARP
jgi:hypothetical protein